MSTQSTKEQMQSHVQAVMSGLDYLEALHIADSCRNK